MKIKKLLLLAFASVCLVSCTGNNTSSVSSGSVGQSSTGPLSSTGNISTSISSPNSSSSSQISSSSSGGDIVDQTDYYKGVDFSLRGTDLRGEIYDLMTETHKVKTSYDDLKWAIPEIEAVPGESHKIYLFYTHDEYDYGSSPMSFSGDVNREHAWPNSRGVGKSGPGSDPYIIKPTWSKDNSSRGNMVYSEPGEGGWTPEMNEYKGDAARVIFYAAAHYGPESSYNLVLNESTSNNKNNMGKLSTLLKWNIEHTVNDWEVMRNDNGQKTLGNRNPFVDHPELACQIWGDTDEATKTVCGSSSKPVEATGITAEDISVQVGREKDLGAKVVPSNASSKTLGYRNYDDTKITVTDGVVKGLAVGETTIEIYLQSNPNITKTIKVTVSEKPVVDQGVPTGTGSLELNPANLGLTTTAYTGEIELGGVNFTVTDCKQSSQNFYLSKTTGSIYNTSSIGNITSVVVKYALPTSQKGSAAAQHGIKLSDTPLLSKPAAYDLSIDESGNGKADVVYTPETANQGYFRFDVLNDKNLQIAGIVINYAN